MMIPTVIFFLLFNGPAPDFKTVNLKQEKVELYKTFVSDTNTKATVLTFFATWCHSCFEEMAFFQGFYNVYKDSGLNVIAVSIDGPSAQSKVRSMVAARSLEFPILLDLKDYVSKLYKIKVLPTAFLLNKKGEIVFTKTGFLPQDKKTYTEKITKLLHESKTKN